MDRATYYREQAAYCAYLLRRAMSADRRARIEQERQDWLVLAYQHGLWSEAEPASPRPAVEARPGLRSAAS